MTIGILETNKIKHISECIFIDNILKIEAQKFETLQDDKVFYGGITVYYYKRNDSKKYHITIFRHFNIQVVTFVYLAILEKLREKHSVFLNITDEYLDELNTIESSEILKNYII